LKKIIKEKKYQIIGFILLFLFAFIWQLIIDNSTIYYDDATYWCLGKEFSWKSETLTWWGFRGWVFPAILSCCYRFGMHVGKEFLGYMIFSSLTFAFLFAIAVSLLIRLLGVKLEEKKQALVCIISGILFFIFFSGLFIYALSDVYAMTAYILALIVAAKLMDKQMTNIYVFGAISLLFGVLVYASYNIRTIYMFTDAILVICVIAILVKSKEYIKTTVGIVCSAVGFYVTSLPQIKMNKGLLGTSSMFVPTDGLMLQQIGWGINNMSYGTYVGDPSVYASAGMSYIDHIGEHILILEGIPTYTPGISTFESYGQFISIAFKHPLDFVGIYTRHLLNMLYPIYPNQYIKDIEKDKSFLIILGFSVMVLAYFGVKKYIGNINKWYWIAMIILPCIFILPGAVEIRFFIPLYLIFCIFAPLGAKEFVTEFKKKKIQYIIGLLVLFCLYIAYGGMMLGSTKDGIALMNYL